MSGKVRSCFVSLSHQIMCLFLQGCCALVLLLCFWSPFSPRSLRFPCCFSRIISFCPSRRSQLHIFSGIWLRAVLTNIFVEPDFLSQLWNGFAEVFQEARLLRESTVCEVLWCGQGLFVLCPLPFLVAHGAESVSSLR